MSARLLLAIALASCLVGLTPAPGDLCCQIAYVYNPGEQTCSALTCPPSQPPGACDTATWWEYAVPATCDTHPDATCVFNGKVTKEVLELKCERRWDFLSNCWYCDSAWTGNESTDEVTDCDFGASVICPFGPN